MKRASRSQSHIVREGHSDLLALAAFTATCLAVAALGGIVTAVSVDSWYLELAKPPFNPPNWIFAPVWTILYLMMALAGWRVWRHRQNTRRRTALVLFSIQLAFNLLWSCLFFGLQAVGTALLEIMVLLTLIVATAASFTRIDRPAGWIMVPYAIWVAFATILNASIWWLN